MSGLLPENSLDNKVTKLQDELLELNKLFELTRLLNYQSDINGLAERIIEFLKIHLDVNNAAFFTKEDDRYRVLSYHNIENHYSLGFKNHEEGIWQIIKEGKPFPVIDEIGKNIYSSFFDVYSLHQLQACLWVPIVHENEIPAIISIGTKNSNTPYTAQDIDFIGKVNDCIKPVVHKLILEKNKEMNLVHLQKTLHNISILYNIGQAMNFIDDLKRLIRMILAKALQTIGAEKGSLMLFDNSTQNLVVKVVYGLPDKETEERINKGMMECTRIKVGEGIAGKVFESRKAIITNLGSDDPRFKQSIDSRVSSILCLPLQVKDEPIGVINICNKKDGQFFNQDDLDFMSALANQAAIAINNAQLYELAITDGLTKLYIYRHFQYLLDTELKRSARYKHPVSLLMMDIDNFKMINDTYGHQVGDEILKHIAEVISKTCRKVDMPSRYGGEEFSVILPETPKENAKIIAERLRQRIEDVIVYTKTGVPISPTISIGISSYPEDAKEPMTLIEAADKALYFAKRNGKNCLAEYSEEGCYLIKCSL